MKADIQLGIIIVNYKSYNETADFINIELPKILIPKKIVVVTNDYDEDGICNMAKQLQSNVVCCDENINYNADIFLINSKDNLGFAKGNNIGADFLINTFNPRYLLFTNNDITILSENIFDLLIKKIESDARIGIIGPAIITHDENGMDIDGSPNPEYVSPTRFILRHLFYPLHHFVKVFRREYNQVEHTNFIEGERYWVSGCFMLTKSDIFIQIGMFDINTFLYAEEMILSERLKMHGLIAYYYPVAKVFHKEQATVSKFFNNYYNSLLAYNSLMYYYTRYVNKSILWPPIFHFTKFVFFYLYHCPSFRKILKMNKK